MPKSKAGTDSHASLGPVAALDLLQDLVRLTAPPAGTMEICEQGLALIARALQARGGILVLGPAEQATPGTVFGKADVAALRALAERATRALDIAGEPGPPGDGASERVAAPLLSAEGALGALALEGPRKIDDEGRAFLRGATRLLGAALQAARMLQKSRLQGELLAQRNVELETLRELAGRVQEQTGEEEILQTALDLVLEKLNLTSGWIFWGESSRKRLDLAASRGVDEGFVRRSRDEGIGDCLCKDVFETGRLRLARNTIDCPRLPDLVSEGRPLTHACIPLKFDRGTQGVMNIANRAGHLFTDPELQFLETVGHQICLAVDKARSTGAEMRRNAEAHALATENARLYRESEESLARLQQAQDGMMRAERLATVGTLAASLAHEVRNPLNSISLQLVLLSRRLKNLEEPLRGEVSSLIESARGEIVRLDGLVEEFLSLSSVDRLNLAEANPVEVVREVVSLMDPSARQQGVRVVVDVGTAPASIRLDREKMKQVLINLVRNAIEAMPQGGTLTVSARATDGGTAIAVADTGSGIEAGLEVFDFFTTSKKGGTGLGLPIARRIVEGHGGSLGYESRIGVGTTFTIVLRSEHEDDASSPARPPGSPDS